MSLLYTPLRLGPRTAPNRIVADGHGTGLARGTFSPELLAYLAARAAGGAGIVITQSACVTAGHGDLPVLPEGRMIPAFRALADAVHPHGSLVFVRLEHPGAQAVYTGSGTPVAHGASPVPLRLLGNAPGVPHAADDAFLTDVIRGFADSAAQAKAAGIDGVELHFAHGDLVEQFLDEETNQRGDRWGDDPLLLAREILHGVRQAVGRRIVVGARVTGGVPGDRDATNRKQQTVRELLELGMLDYVSVTAGHYADARGTAGAIPDASHPPAVWAEFGRRIREGSPVPVMLAGRITSAPLAASLIDDGAADLVAMTRALVADPDLPRKDPAQVRPCVGIQDGCWGRLAKGQPLRCAFNPHAGRELLPLPAPVRTERHVVVIGAGPAGLEAARSAAAQGHLVTVVERSGQVGGQVRIASGTPYRHELADVLDWQERQCRSLGVAIQLDRDVDANGVLALRPDVVILATGSRGTALDGEIDVREALTTPMGDHVLVYDKWGGRAALSVAEGLVAAGKRVVFATPLTFPGQGADETVRLPSCLRLGAAGVRFHATVTLTGLAGGEAWLRDDYSGRSFSERADAVVASRPPQPADELAEALRGRVELHVIGDARSPRGVTEATAEGFETARLLGDVIPSVQVL
ncbi:MULTISPECIES: FAD-dependent oxidoreductase [Actinoplanes]|uniref:oxidoreductase n=1 Tax=Actinoplanes TaxID=1865 RepID=UPI0005F2A23B|nr:MULTISPECIES: FAD-dependent oxidoreductase [Actinoplanes]GLY04358.1 oxidoreductase [Actinoplanes sp. NBRC 101535]